MFSMRWYLQERRRNESSRKARAFDVSQHSSIGRSISMSKVAIVVLADTDTHEDMGRATNALETAKELKEADDEVQLIFDGAGTKWIPELSRQDSRFSRQYDPIRDRIAGACRFCAVAFGVKDQIERTDIPLLGEYEGHPSLRKLISQGYQIIAF